MLCPDFSYFYNYSYNRWISFRLPANTQFITDMEQQIEQVTVANANVIDWSVEDSLTFDELKKSVAMKARKQEFVNEIDLSLEEIQLAGRTIEQVHISNEF